MHDSNGMGKSGAERLWSKRIAPLFPKHVWTPEEIALFIERAAAYEYDSAYAVVSQYKTECRYKSPCMATMLRLFNLAKNGPEGRKVGDEKMEAMRRMFSETTNERRREQGISRDLHIPELIAIGRAKVEATRDDLLRRMEDGAFMSQRQYAGKPTWDELTNPDEVRSRILCWRYWIIFDSCESYEPEMAFT